MKLEFDGDFPRCFNSLEEFKAWSQAARGSSPRAGFCTDCTPEYKSKMESQGRCQYPQVEFYEWDKDGYFPTKYFHDKRSAIQGDVGHDGQEDYPRFTYGEQAIRWAEK